MQSRVQDREWLPCTWSGEQRTLRVWRPLIWEYNSVLPRNVVLFKIRREVALKILQLALLLILLAVGAAAQVPSNTAAAPDVAVINISWHFVAPGNPKLSEERISASPDYAARMAVNTARINENKSLRDSGGSPPPPMLISLPTIPDSPPIVRPWSGFVYEFTVKNTGAKTIRQMAFDYVFFDDTFVGPGMQRTVRRRQYKSKVKIRPGMTAKVVVRSSLPPMGTVKAQNPADQAGQQMVVTTIKYADGTEWQRSSNSPVAPK